MGDIASMLKMVENTRQTFRFIGTEFPENPKVGDIVCNNGTNYVYNHEWEPLGTGTAPSTLPRKYKQNLKCASCGAPLFPDSLEYERGLAKCAYCGMLTSIYEE